MTRVFEFKVTLLSFKSRVSPAEPVGGTPSDMIHPITLCSSEFFLYCFDMHGLICIFPEQVRRDSTTPGGGIGNTGLLILARTAAHASTHLMGRIQLEGFASSPHSDALRTTVQETGRRYSIKANYQSTGNWHSSATTALPTVL